MEGGGWRGEPCGEMTSRCRCLCRVDSELIGEKRRCVERTRLMPEAFVHGVTAGEAARMMTVGKKRRRLLSRRGRMPEA